MFPSIRQGSFFALAHKLFPFKQLGHSLLLGFGASILAFAGSAQAAETIILTYSDNTVTITLDDLQNFARTGEATRSEVQEFFQKVPEAARVVQDIFDSEIYVSEAFLEDVLDSSIGEFVLTKLNELIASPSLRGDLSPLRTALLDSYEDNNRFTLLEVVENFPEETLDVNLNGLEPVYNDVTAFVERIYPALQVAEGFLRDLVCDCETATTPETTAPIDDTNDTENTDDPETMNDSEEDAETDSTQSTLPVSDRVAASQNCNNPQTSASASVPSQAANVIPVAASVTSVAEPVKP